MSLKTLQQAAMKRAAVKEKFLFLRSANECDFQVIRMSEPSSEKQAEGTRDCATMNQSAIRGLVTNIVFVRQEGTLSAVVNKPQWLSTQLARVFSYRSPEYPSACFSYHFYPLIKWLQL